MNRIKHGTRVNGNNSDYRPGNELLAVSCRILLLANCNAASKVLERLGEALE